MIGKKGNPASRVAHGLQSERERCSMIAMRLVAVGHCDRLDPAATHLGRKTSCIPDKCGATRSVRIRVAPVQPDDGRIARAEPSQSGLGLVPADRC